jgi:hypothetical protein
VSKNRQQHVRCFGPHRLEPALRVAETGAQNRAQQQVVGPGDHLPFGTAHHPGRLGEPASDGDVAVPGQQGRDQRKQGGEIGRQVDVHVGDDPGVAAAPHRVQGAAASFLG